MKKIVLFVSTLLLATQICGYGEADIGSYGIYAYADETDPDSSAISNDYDEALENTIDYEESTDIISYDEENRSYYDDDDAVIDKDSENNYIKGNVAADPKDIIYTDKIVKKLDELSPNYIKKSISQNIQITGNKNNIQGIDYNSGYYYYIAKTKADDPKAIITKVKSGSSPTVVMTVNNAGHSNDLVVSRDSAGEICYIINTGKYDKGEHPGGILVTGKNKTAVLYKLYYNNERIDCSGALSLVKRDAANQKWTLAFKKGRAIYKFDIPMNGTQNASVNASSKIITKDKDGNTFVYGSLIKYKKGGKNYELGLSMQGMDYSGGKYYVTYNEQFLSDKKDENGDYKIIGHSYVNYVIAYDAATGKITKTYKIKTPSVFLDGNKCELEGATMVENKLSLLLYNSSNMGIYNLTP